MPCESIRSRSAAPRTHCCSPDSCASRPPIFWHGLRPARPARPGLEASRWFRIRFMDENRSVFFLSNILNIVADTPCGMCLVRSTCGPRPPGRWALGDWRHHGGSQRRRRLAAATRAPCPGPASHWRCSRAAASCGTSTGNAPASKPASAPAAAPHACWVSRA